MCRLFSIDCFTRSNVTAMPGGAGAADLIAVDLLMQEPLALYVRYMIELHTLGRYTIAPCKPTRGVVALDAWTHLAQFRGACAHCAVGAPLTLGISARLDGSTAWPQVAARNIVCPDPLHFAVLVLC